ncbi:glycosyltransferase family 2 protein [Nibrella saemangeumensis]|uniref:Glycosyltransferase family 2 protein n=1 Tax=Nibrella saemangeumensis TaxID=1084526 RepID=A0ABP8NEF1_9BACT
MPLLSIITVTYNAGRFLERTIQSIGKPTGEVEYIIVDGGSKDNTLNLVRQYEDHVTKWVSEPDRGLYDAMNKGLKLAQGDYVWFMNAGDEIHDATVLPRLKERLTSNADVYYSDALFVRDDGSPVGLRSEITPHTLPKQLAWQDMALGMKVCHQAFIVRRTIAPTYLVDNLSADLDWEINSLKAAHTAEYLDFVLCKYLIGGLSVQQHRRSLTDRFKVLVHHFGWVATVKNHWQISLRALRFKLSANN